MGEGHSYPPLVPQFVTGAPLPIPSTTVQPDLRIGPQKDVPNLLLTALAVLPDGRGGPADNPI